jgi:hypothetical protein
MKVHFANRSALAALAGSLLWLALAAQAHADRPRGTYKWAAPDQIQARVARAHASNIIFLNRCADGCVVTPGPEDSRQNTSIVPQETSVIPAFGHGDEAWSYLVSCVREIYAPFDIVITDVDPGSQSHFEAIVAGSPEDVQQPHDVGGVAPFSCGVIDNAMTYSFAAVYDDMRWLCETVAHETAHAFGLDHEYLCEDPMTYLDGCGEKSFRDVDAPCGEDGPRECLCGGATQNSYARIAAEFNTLPPTPPSVSIVQPQTGDEVEPGFAIVVEAEDDVALASIDVYLDGALMAEETGLVAGPYGFSAPAQLPSGDFELRAVATDDRGTESEHVIVVSRTSCSGDDGCSDGQICAGGTCTEGSRETDDGGCSSAAGGGGLSAGLLLAGLLGAWLSHARRRGARMPARARSRWPASGSRGSR